MMLATRALDRSLPRLLKEQQRGGAHPLRIPEKAMPGQACCQTAPPSLTAVTVHDMAK